MVFPDKGSLDAPGINSTITNTYSAAIFQIGDFPGIQRVSITLSKQARNANTNNPSIYFSMTWEDSINRPLLIFHYVVITPLLVASLVKMLRCYKVGLTTPLAHHISLQSNQRNYLIQGEIT